MTSFLTSSGLPPEYPTALLQEETILNLGEFHGCGAFRVVVRHVIDPSAYGITSHRPSVVGLNISAAAVTFPHSPIEPKVVAIWIKNDGHAVVGHAMSKQDFHPNKAYR